MGMPPIFVTGGSGGIGKSSGAREVAGLLAERTVNGLQRVALVDANLAQQTQREFHRIPPDRGLETAVLSDDILDAMVTPNEMGVKVPYAVLPGPLDPRPDNMPRLLDVLGRSIGQLTRLCDWTVVDLDKIDRVLLADSESVCGMVMLPWVDGGNARIIYKLASTPDKLADGMEALQALNRPGSTGIVGVVTPGGPDPTEEQWRAKTQGLGVWLGVEHWTVDSGASIAQGLVGVRPLEWMPGLLDWLGVQPMPVRDTRKGGVFGWFRRRG